MEPVTWATGFGALLASCAFLVYHNREVSYSSLLDLSITARQQRLYDEHGLNIEQWTEMGQSLFPSPHVHNSLVSFRHPMRSKKEEA